MFRKTLSIKSRQSSAFKESTERFSKTSLPLKTTKNKPKEQDPNWKKPSKMDTPPMVASSSIATPDLTSLSQSLSTKTPTRKMAEIPTTTLTSPTLESTLLRTQAKFTKSNLPFKKKWKETPSWTKGFQSWKVKTFISEPRTNKLKTSRLKTSNWREKFDLCLCQMWAESTPKKFLTKWVTWNRMANTWDKRPRCYSARFRTTTDTLMILW